MVVFFAVTGDVGENQICPAAAIANAVPPSKLKEFVANQSP
jgi:hypothetical protein